MINRESYVNELLFIYGYGGHTLLSGTIAV